MGRSAVFQLSWSTHDASRVSHLPHSAVVLSLQCATYSISLRCWSNVKQMGDGKSKSWLRTRVEKTLVKGLTRAYSTVQVDPDKFLLQLRTAYRVPISGYHGVYSLEVGELDSVAA